jgi:hypothetical protein
MLPGPMSMGKPLGDTSDLPEGQTVQGIDKSNSHWRTHGVEERLFFFKSSLAGPSYLGATANSRAAWLVVGRLLRLNML